MLDKMKQLWEMQKKVQELKRELDRTSFEVKSPDGLVTIVMNGSQQAQEATVADGADPQKLGRAVKDAVNLAVKRSQEIAAQKMKEIGGLNLPGM
jgi:DNA-binding YbaB/EbfC family protein